MAMPKLNDILLPLLKFLSDEDEHSLRARDGYSCWPHDQDQTIEWLRQDYAQLKNNFLMLFVVWPVKEPVLPKMFGVSSTTYTARAHTQFSHLRILRAQFK